MHVHPVEVRLVHAGREQHREVARQVDERRPQDGAHRVPRCDTYICWYLRVAMVREDIDAEHHPRNHHQHVQRQRQLGVLQALVVAAQQRDHCAQNDHVPQRRRRHSELFAPQLHAAQPRNNVVRQPHVRRQQPSEQHAVDMQRAQPAVGEVRNRAEQLRPDELRRDGERDDPDDEEVADRAEQKPLRRQYRYGLRGEQRRSSARFDSPLVPGTIDSSGVDLTRSNCE